jgi:3'5'-cyclic nucleotide phosphodiesterase
VSRRYACPLEEGYIPPNEECYAREKTQSTFDEVSEIITLPTFDVRVVLNQQDPAAIELDEKVMSQVHTFVSNIAATYHDNPFHSFEHASHVTQSVIKLLSRVVAPTNVEGEQVDEEGNHVIAADALHDHTYGITSDPLTQFACAFSSLIHDADHPGMFNFF